MVAGALSVLTLEPRTEHALLESLRPGDGGARLAVDAGFAEVLLAEVARSAEAGEQRGLTPVLVCSPPLRLPLRRLAKMTAPRLPVLSYAEIAGCTARIDSLGMVSGAHAIAA